MKLHFLGNVDPPLIHKTVINCCPESYTLGNTRTTKVSERIRNCNKNQLYFLQQIVKIRRLEWIIGFVRFP